MHNYNEFKGAQGFRLNDTKYSAHYQEKEVILAEGTPMVVLDIEEVQMDRFDKRMSVYDQFWDNFGGQGPIAGLDFSGKTITVIYLFNTNLA